MMKFYKVVGWDGMCKDNRFEKVFNTLENACEYCKKETWADLADTIKELVVEVNEEGEFVAVEVNEFARPIRKK